MKLNIFTIAALAVAASLSSCSDEFLQEKKNYDNTNVDAYNYFSGANGRVSDIYAVAMPSANNEAVAWKLTANGIADEWSKSTEEYSGFGMFVNPQNEMLSTGTSNAVPDYFQGQANNIRESAWGRIRNINDVIRGISGSTLTQEEKDQLLGQVYFFRAWCYYNMVKWYGGVPIITEVLDPVASSFTPRSTTKQCFDFICADLDKAAELLAPFTTNGGWKSAENYGRVTSGTALALKSRVLVMWASPLFNRTNDAARWQRAYKEIGEAIPVINSCGYGLAYEGNPGVNASNWAKMFSEVPNSEAVFVTLYNTIATGGTPDYSRPNSWEHGVRPSNAQGGGGKVPSANIVDLFPMADGKRPSTYANYSKLEGSAISYDASFPFADRDPRFYRTFAFPGVRWAFSGDPRDPKNNNPYNGDSYELWNYVWYEASGQRDDIERSGKAYGADGLLDNCKGMYVRKRSDDLDVNSAPRYVYDLSNGFKFSANPYMEIRYAEVLLNYAEAACNAGSPAVAVEQLKRIRTRVGYTGDCGLQANLSADAAACMAAILYERQIEFAYEGKRFEDARRWMLFDGGAGKVEGAPSTWTLTGWGGNTCTWLGCTPLNGTRRDNMEFRVNDSHNNGLGGSKFGADGTNPDPIASVTRPAALDLRKPLSGQMDALKAFYSANLERARKKGDSYDSDHSELYMNFRPKYYFLGFSQGASSNNIGLLQNIGWADYNNGGALGTFDPLAE